MNKFIPFAVTLCLGASIPALTQELDNPKFVEFGALETGTDGLQYVHGAGTPFTGKSIEFYPDGTKRNIYTWKDGYKHGPHIIWHENTCRKKQEVRYVDGWMDGTVLEWFSNGRLKSHGYYEKGKKNGLSLTWHENGQWALAIHYQAGQLAGLTVEKDPNGTTLKELLYEGGSLLKPPVGH